MFESILEALFIPAPTFYVYDVILHILLFSDSLLIFTDKIDITAFVF